MAMRHQVERLSAEEVARIVVAVLVYAALAAIFLRSLLNWL